MDSEHFSNPLAPVGNASAAARSKPAQEDRSQPLTNSDFRKLMMTPRAVSSSSSSTPMPGSVRGSIRSKHFKQPPSKGGGSGGTSELHKKKKTFYESYRKEDDVLSDLSKRYRDRAKERRDNREAIDDRMTTSAYHAVGPTSLDMDSETRRRQQIEESKFLGGDMEHTHLVKGLDYVLLEKIKDEIQNKQDEEEYRKQLEENLAKKEKEEQKKTKAGLGKLADISFDEQDRYAVKSKFAENILKIAHKKTGGERNEIFAQGRMSYQYDLADFSESDIPTSVIISKAEMMNNEAYNTISTNKIVIDKLIQILHNLRTESSSKKSSKVSRFDKQEVKSATTTTTKLSKRIDDDEDNIYDDVGDYVPVPSKSHKSSSQDTKKDKPSQKHSYFPTDKSKDTSSSKRSEEQLALEMAASVIGSMAAQSDNVAPIRRRAKIQSEPDSYAECYPGAPENDDALGDDSDEGEPSGKKKPASGGGSRWDKESGRSDADNKPNEGKANKKAKKDDKAKFDRDLQRINSIISKRKEAGQDIGLDHISEKRRKER